MHTHTEQRILPYTPAQMYALVADIEKYPEFLPWCNMARILSREQGAFTGELSICFKHICQSYVSHVAIFPPENEHGKAMIRVTQIRGPFQQLENRWVFSPAVEGACVVDFYLKFTFKSKILDKIIGLLFHKATKKMVEAFEERAAKLYG